MKHDNVKAMKKYQINFIFLHNNMKLRLNFDQKYNKYI